MAKNFTPQALESDVSLDVEPLNKPFAEPSIEPEVNGQLGSTEFNEIHLTYPATRRDVGLVLGISNVMVGRRLKAIREFFPQSKLLTPDDRLTQFGVEKIWEYGELKKKGFEARYEKLSDSPASSPTPESSVLTLAQSPCARSRFSQWEQAIATSESQIEAIDVEFVDSQTAQSTALDTYSIARERIERLQAAATHNRETSNATFLNQVAADALKLKAQADQLRELILSGQLDASALSAMGLTEGSHAAKSPN